MTAHEQVLRIATVATPWTDPLGNVWCVTPSDNHFLNAYRVFPDGWRLVDDSRLPFTCHPALLAGLGRTLPADPTPPKRVAQVVRYGAWELAAKGDVLFESLHGEQWRPAKDWPFTRDFITLVAEAFAFAGDVLPGEEGR